MTTELLDTAPVASAAASQETPPAADTAAPAGEGAPPAGADNPPAADATATGEVAGGEGDITYEPFAMPEGMVADEELMTEFQATAKELKLPQESAQKLVELQGKMVAKQQATIQNTWAQWVEQTKTDKEFGGDALNENLGIAKLGMDEHASPKLRALLHESRLGNHPEVIRLFLKLGKPLLEDGRIVSGSRAGAPADPAKRLFPNQN